MRTRRQLVKRPLPPTVAQNLQRASLVLVASANSDNDLSVLWSAIDHVMESHKKTLDFLNR